MRCLFLCLAVFAGGLLGGVKHCSADLITRSFFQHVRGTVVTTGGQWDDVAVNNSLPPDNLSVRVVDNMTPGWASADQTVLDYSYDESLTSLSLHVMSELDAQLPVPPSAVASSGVRADSDLIYSLYLDSSAFYSISASTLLQSPVPLASGTNMVVRLNGTGFTVNENESLTDTGV